MYRYFKSTFYTPPIFDPITNEFIQNLIYFQQMTIIGYGNINQKQRINKLSAINCLISVVNPFVLKSFRLSLSQPILSFLSAPLIKITPHRR